MRVLTIAEITALEKGEHVPSFRGRFTKIGKFVAGKNDHGPWSFQNCEVTDGSSAIKLKLKNRPEASADWVGATVLFESDTTGKQPFTGIVRDIDEYRGKSTPCVVVDDRAKWIEWNSESAPATEAQPAEPPHAVMPPPASKQAPPQGAAAKTAPAAQQAQQPAPQQQTAPVQQSPPATKRAPGEPGTPEYYRETVQMARKHLGKCANALRLGYDAAFHVGKYVYETYKVELAGDELERIAVSFKIDLERAGLLEKLPHGKLEPYLPKPE